MATLDSETSKQPAQQTYAYRGGTFHLVPWAVWIFALVFAWLIYFVGGSDASKTRMHLLVLLCLFILLPAFLGFHWEWSFRNQPGRIVVDSRGLTCTLPWGRRRHFQWEDIRQVRCIGRRFRREICAWEIRGAAPNDCITITWELKGYQELLRTIKARATRCQLFDDID